MLARDTPTARLLADVTPDQPGLPGPGRRSLTPEAVSTQLGAWAK